VDTVYILFLHEPVSENLQIKMDYVRKMQSSREKKYIITQVDIFTPGSNQNVRCNGMKPRIILRQKKHNLLDNAVIFVSSFAWKKTVFFKRL
jgi:hypothetical protein